MTWNRVRTRTSDCFYWNGRTPRMVEAVLKWNLKSGTHDWVKDGKQSMVLDTVQDESVLAEELGVPIPPVTDMKIKVQSHTDGVFSFGLSNMSLEDAQAHLMTCAKEVKIKLFYDYNKVYKVGNEWRVMYRFFPAKRDPILTVLHNDIPDFD